ncbi:hypothetical protein ACFYWS_04085 [Streptomyces sp. NPDC002795]|uniref:hypothetical protein n=1 Tax=Streptomyces sp. NPDC002795 TaxID=3364665 RepID=UPI0036C3326C
MHATAAHPSAALASRAAATAAARPLDELDLALARDPDVTDTRTHLVQRLHQEGSQWRLVALSREQNAPCCGPSPGCSGAARRCCAARRPTCTRAVSTT